MFRPGQADGGGDPRRQQEAPAPHAQPPGDGLGRLLDDGVLAPAQLLYRHFDRHTNPVVEEVVQAHPELFEGWTSADFDELHSRRATGGALTTEGALAAVEQMNRSRALHRILSVLLETSQADVIAAVLEALYEQTVARQ